MRSVHRIGEEQRAKTGLLLLTGDCQSPKQRGADQGIARNVLAYTNWHFALGQRGRAQRVVAQNGGWLLRLNQDEDTVGLASLVLTGLCLQVPVQAFNTAGKTGAIMIAAERFNLQVGRTFGKHLTTDPSFVFGHGVGESLVRLWWVLQRIKERCTVTFRQSQRLVLGN